jgi:hypothetical protein
VLRRPGLSAALSLVMLVILILLSRFKHDILFMTASFVDCHRHQRRRTRRELQRASSTVPIVFSSANDPVGAGLIESLARPGTDATGLSVFESGQSAKLIELLKEIAPRLTRAAVVRNPDGTGGAAYFAVIQAAAGSLGMEVRPIDVRNDGAIERGLASLAREQNAGIVVPAGGASLVHRESIVKLAAQHRLPAVYGARASIIATRHRPGESVVRRVAPPHLKENQRRQARPARWCAASPRWPRPGEPHRS